jgi:hypothetical protein
MLSSPSPLFVEGDSNWTWKHEAILSYPNDDFCCFTYDLACVKCDIPGLSDIAPITRSWMTNYDDVGVGEERIVLLV